MGQTNLWVEWSEKTGETVLWNPNIFSGEPIYPRITPKLIHVDTLLALLGKRYEAGVQFGFCTDNPHTSDLARYRYRKEVMPYGEDEPEWIELQGGKNMVRYQPYIRLDASLSRSFYFGNNELDIKLSVYNVLNSKNVFMYYYDYDEEPPIKEPFNMLPIIPSIEFIYKF